MLQVLVLFVLAAEPAPEAPADVVKPGQASSPWTADERACVDGDAAGCDRAALDAQRRGQDEAVVQAWRRLAEQAREALASPPSKPPLLPASEAERPAPEPSTSAAPPESRPQESKAKQSKASGPSLSEFVKPGALGRTPLRLGAELGAGLVVGLGGAVVVGAAVFVPVVVVVGIIHLVARAIFGSLVSGPNAFAVAWDLALPVAAVGALVGLAIGPFVGARLFEKAALPLLPAIVAAALGAAGGTIATVLLYRMMNITNPFVHPVALWLPPLLPVPIGILVAAVIGAEVGVALRVTPGVAVVPGGLAVTAAARF